MPVEYCQVAANKRLEKFVRLKAPMKLHPRPSIIQFSFLPTPFESGWAKDGWPNISYVSSWIVYLPAKRPGYHPRLVSIIKYNFHWSLSRCSIRIGTRTSVHRVRDPLTNRRLADASSYARTWNFINDLTRGCTGKNRRKRRKGNCWEDKLAYGRLCECLFFRQLSLFLEI